jgi:hypothetical protein
MEIHFNNINRMNKPPAAPASSPLQPARDGVLFAGAAALNRALEETPDIRAERLQPLRHYVSSPDYPPADVLREVADLLAAQIRAANTAGS